MWILTPAPRSKTCFGFLFKNVSSDFHDCASPPHLMPQGPCSVPASNVVATQIPRTCPRKVVARLPVLCVRASRVQCSTKHAHRPHPERRTDCSAISRGKEKAGRRMLLVKHYPKCPEGQVLLELTVYPANTVRSYDAAPPKLLDQCHKGKVGEAIKFARL